MNFAIIHRHKDCFRRHPKEVGYFKNGHYALLRLTTSSNVYTEPKPYPPAKALHSQFNKKFLQWLHLGVFVEQDRLLEFRGNFSPIKKKDGTFRFWCCYPFNNGSTGTRRRFQVRYNPGCQQLLPVI